MNLKFNVYGVLATALINTLVVLPANSKPAVQTLQRLPDGIYIYSKVRLLKQLGSEYHIIRKKGRNFIDYGYLYQADSSCMAGTISGNTLNTTRRYDSDVIENGVYQTNESINLNDYYKLSSRYISAEDREGIQSCIKRMSR